MAAIKKAKIGENVVQNSVLPSSQLLRSVGNLQGIEKPPRGQEKNQEKDLQMGGSCKSPSIPLKPYIKVNNWEYIVVKPQYIYGNYTLS